MSLTSRVLFASLLFLFTNQFAFAGSEFSPKITPSGAPSPTPTPAPIFPPTLGKSGVDKAGNCTIDYVQFYSIVSSEISTVSSYLKNQEAPPNMIESVLSCAKIQSGFDGVICNIPSLGRQAKTADFADTCGAVRDLFKELTGKEAPVGVPVLQTVSDTSPLALVNATGINVRVQNAAELQKLLSKPQLTYAINGKVYDLKSSLGTDSTVRCTLVAPANMNFQNGQVLKVTQILETYSKGYRETLISFGNESVGIDCASKTGAGLKLGELKNAFGNLISISYAK